MSIKRIASTKTNQKFCFVCLEKQFSHFLSSFPHFHFYFCFYFDLFDFELQQPRISSKSRLSKKSRTSTKVLDFVENLGFGQKSRITWAAETSTVLRDRIRCHVLLIRGLVGDTRPLPQNPPRLHSALPLCRKFGHPSGDAGEGSFAAADAAVAAPT